MKTCACCSLRGGASAVRTMVYASSRNTARCISRALSLPINAAWMLQRLRGNGSQRGSGCWTISDQSASRSVCGPEQARKMAAHAKWKVLLIGDQILRSLVRVKVGLVGRNHTVVRFEEQWWSNMVIMHRARCKPAPTTIVASRGVCGEMVSELAPQAYPSSNEMSGSTLDSMRSCRSCWRPPLSRHFGADTSSLEIDARMQYPGPVNAAHTYLTMHPCPHTHPDPLPKTYLPSTFASIFRLSVVSRKSSPIGSNGAARDMESPLRVASVCARRPHMRAWHVE